MDFNMGFLVDSPWLLLLLGGLPLFIWYQYRYTSRIVGARKHVAVLLRSFILLLIIVLIAGVHPYSSKLQRNAVVVADRSDSVGNEEEALAFIQSILSNDDDQDYMGVVSFAKNIMIDRVLQPFAELQLPTAFHTLADQDGSHIAAALRQAAGMLHQSNGGRIVLLTDGVETSGSILKEVQVLQAMGIAVDAVLLEAEDGKDAAVSAVKTPSQLKLGERYQLNVTIDSTHQATAELLLYEDNALIAQQEVELIRGANDFLIDAIAVEPGMKEYRAVIRMQGDLQTENNIGYSFSRVDGPAGVLIVEGEQGSSRNIESALAASYIGYRTILPSELSYELTSYLQTEAIIFNNVSAVDLPQIKMEHIASAVRNYGVGFVMLGGNDSFGLGGYFDTPIEEILPVNMQLSGKKAIPDLQLMLVIDHSGSMDGSKMELAKEAAARTVELMRPVDTVGVLAFDSAPSWIVSPVKLEDRESVIQSIMSIQPAGGTDIYPALARAYDGFNLEARGRKHIILLTDGISPYTPSYEGLLSNLKENNITLSTVAVGQGSDASFLSSLAEAGGGRAYYTEDASTLPAIFSRETTLMSRAYIVEGDIEPQLGYAGSWSQLWRSGVPKLEAYVATSAKSTAEVALWSPQEDPLLARWHVGSGKSVAFMSDVNGKWSEEWISWSSFPDVFTEWVRWTYPQFVASRYMIENSAETDPGKLIITSSEAESLSNLGLTINSGDRRSIVPLVPIGNGKYEANVGELDSGVYFTQIGELSQELGSPGVELEQQLQHGITTGFTIPYPAEYRLDIRPTDGVNKLEALTEMTGGRMLSLEDANQLYLFEPVANKQSYYWTRELLILLLVLWLIDIANRRLSWYLPKRKAIAAAQQAQTEEESVNGQSQSIHTNNSVLQRLQSSKQKVEKRSRLEGLNGRNAQMQSPEDVAAKNKSELDLKRERERIPVHGAKSTGTFTGAADIEKSATAERSTETAVKEASQPAAKASTSSKASEAATKADAKDTMNRLLAAKNRNKR